MSAENVVAAQKALETVLADVKEKLGSETPAAKISYIAFRTNTNNLIEALGYLVEDFFNELDEGPEEEEGERGEG